MNSHRAVVAAILLSVGCTTPTATITQGAPTQKGAALTGWAYFTPGGAQTVFVGATSRTLCEVAREKALENIPASKPTPCLPVKVTAD
jgi:hypothetical protein